MSRVDFAFGAGHRLRMACEVACKHYMAGHRLLVYTRDSKRLAYFDRLLWSFEGAAFVPHVHSDDPLAPRTPVVLTQADPAGVLATLHEQDAAGTGLVNKLQPAGAAPALPWLLNLDLHCPPGAEAFTRILEIVSGHEDDRAAARRRWRDYQAQGHELHAHDLSASA